MGFLAVTFPEIKILHNIQRTESAPVKVVGNFTKQYRIKKHRWPRYDWTIPSHVLKNDHIQVIRDFLVSVDYSLSSFRFVDPYFPAFTGEYLTHSTGEYWLLNTPEGKPIFNPIINELTVTLGGPTQTKTFSIDANGQPVIRIIGTNEFSQVDITGNCYMTARFDSTFATSLVALDTNNLPVGAAVNELKLTEVFEY